MSVTSRDDGKARRTPRLLEFAAERPEEAEIDTSAQVPSDAAPALLLPSSSSQGRFRF